jgi:methanogenic corrinoid protein MtbC1
VLAAALARLPQMPLSPPSYLDDSDPYVGIAQQYLDHLLKGNRLAASHLVLDAVAQRGVPVRDIYLHVFQPCQYEIGRLWQMNQISVAQEHFCTAATQLVMSQLYPFIFATPKCGRRLVAACVGQELHEIGLRMVADLFELEGWDTLYLGANTPAHSIAAIAADHAPDVLALSATMTFHLPNVAEVIEHVRRRPGSPPKILVGGYPFNLAPDLWREVGADGYAPDAEGAIALANQLLSSNL